MMVLMNHQERVKVKLEVRSSQDTVHMQRMHSAVVETVTTSTKHHRTNFCDPPSLLILGQSIKFQDRHTQQHGSVSRITVIFIIFFLQKFSSSSIGYTCMNQLVYNGGINTELGVKTIRRSWSPAASRRRPTDGDH